MNESTQIGEWIKTATIVLGFVALWIRLSGRAEKREISNDPQKPVTVKGEPQYAEKEHGHSLYMLRTECPARHSDDERRSREQFQDIKTDISELSLKIDKHNEQAEERASRVHKRVDEAEKTATRAETAVNHHLDDHRSKGAIHAG